MILFQGKPVLEHNIILCKKYGIRDIYINVYHLASNIIDYFGHGEKWGVNITYSEEVELLGTAGATRKIFNDYIKETDSLNDPFFVVYGDNFSKYNLYAVADTFNKQSTLAVIGFHYREDVSTSGIAEFADDGRITRFIEKPKPGESESHWVNAGIYYLDPKIIKYIPEGFSDFARDIFPSMISGNMKIYGVKAAADVKAFDTPEMLLRNSK